MHLYPLHDRTVVVVDILRATSCMVTALANGADHIIPVAELEDCLVMKKTGYITAGERDGEKVEGFDKGNSPFEYMGGQVRGRKIAFTTTNGTHAIAKSKGANEILIGSFLNLSAVASHLIRGENNALIVCAAWKGKINLEDTLFAGALVSQLDKDFENECDAPLAAKYLYEHAQADMAAFLSNSSHVKRLNRLNIHEDIGFCLTLDEYDVLPRLVDGHLRVG